MYLGLRVAAEFSDEAGKRLVEKIAPGFIEEKWSQDLREENDKSFALVRDCNGHEMVNNLQTKR